MSWTAAVPCAMGVAAAVAIGCGGSPSGPDPDESGACVVPTALSDTFVLDDVTVLSYDDGIPRAGHSVRVVGGRIDAVAEAIPVSDGAVRVPGCGRYLVPGLTDMHVHLSRADLPSYLDAGVTTVRNLWGFPDLLAIRDETRAGTLQGPTVHVISSGLDGLPEKWPYTRLVPDPARADSVVAAEQARGYQTLKLYQDLSRPVFDAVVAGARSRGMAYGGHVPHRVGLDAALNARYRFIEHLSGYELALGPGPLGAFGWRTIDATRIPGLVDATVAAGTWNTPTLAIFSLIASGDAEVVDNRRAVVAALYRGGAPLLVGTDAGIGRTAPGSSLHDEIAEFVAAGIPVLDVLRMATVDAARFLGAEDEFGRVAPGQRADLLLVDGDPLSNPSVLRHPVAVIARGIRVR